MHFVLVGPGALGCLLASKLSRADQKGEHSFTLLDHNAVRAQKLTEQGILYRHKDTEERVTIPVSSSPTESGHADVVILCVKSYDIERCLGFCSPLLSDGTLLLFMQNGVAHLEAESLTGKATPVYGTTTEGANLAGPGVVKHAGIGLTQFGFLGSVSERAEARLREITDYFNDAGLKSRVTDNILSRLWTKLMVNTGINGLTAILGCTNGELLTLPGAAERMESLVEEARKVARASDIDVPEDSIEITRDVCAKTSANISSMLQDVRCSRRTEIDAINGAVITTAQKLGIDTPENRLLVCQVKELEKTYLK